MKVWIDRKGMHYHLGKWCESIKETEIKIGGVYEDVEWVDAYNRGYDPCPICHSDRSVKIARAVRVSK